ncbi:MAG: phosphoserine phosphatase SerB [Rhizobiales bacterium]|nr:phosphoserine phosphatase SerB [Hyphomicrobiales bacterium]
MNNVLTLIGNNATPLAPAHVECARAALPASGEVDWLAPGHACDIPFESADRAAAEAAVRAALAGIAIDIASQPVEGRRKKLLVADMDSTIIQQECIDELADELGIKPQIAAITERAMRGEIEFEPALIERVGLLRGLDLDALERVYQKRITETPGGRSLTATMRAHSATCALVSGGFTFFTQRVAKAVGFNINQANELLFEDGKLTGAVAMPILGRQAKIDALVSLRAEYGLPAIATMAVGDGANDLGMIGEAGLGVAFHAKPVVAEAAAARINHGDLTSLLYLQGYRASDIIKG